MREGAAVLIAGPTASGKSRLAMELAERYDGVVINTDALQVYADLRILTARPSAAEEAALPHALYGHVATHDVYSAGRFLREARPVLADCRERGRLAIFCGGTGLYFKALLGHLADMPSVPAPVREALRDRLAAEGPAALHDELKTLDPEAAARIGSADGQRIVRALEIRQATGLPLSYFQQQPGTALIDPARSPKVVISPQRSILRERIATRFDTMIDAGAIDEVARFRKIPSASASAAAKAIGVQEFMQLLDGHLDLATARDLAIMRTHRYAKRQETWFRHQFDKDWNRIDPANDDLSCLLQRDIKAICGID